MSMIGTSVARKEDPALLTAGGTYVADSGPADALHAVFVRSMIAHGTIESIEVVWEEPQLGLRGPDRNGIEGQ